jgi:hypothetical protein
MTTAINPHYVTLKFNPEESVAEKLPETPIQGHSVKSSTNQFTTNKAPKLQGTATYTSGHTVKNIFGIQHLKYSD